LATVLTDPSFASYLLSPRFSLAEQVWAQEAEGITIMSGSTNTRLGEHRRPGKAAVETAFGMRQSAHNKRPAALEKALIAASQRHRTCLLRHLSTVRIQILPYQPGLAVPRSRLLNGQPPPDLTVF
jgi:hypothetical protein